MVAVAVVHFVLGAICAVLGVLFSIGLALFAGMSAISDIDLGRSSEWDVPLSLAVTGLVTGGFVWQGVRLLRMRHGPPDAWKQPSFLVVEAVLGLVLLAVLGAFVYLLVTEGRGA